MRDWDGTVSDVSIPSLRSSPLIRKAMTDSNQSLRELFKAQSTQLQKSLESYEKAFKEKNGEGRNWQRDTPTAEGN
jgi:hypothetical protein